MIITLAGDGNYRLSRRIDLSTVDLCIGEILHCALQILVQIKKTVSILEANIFNRPTFWMKHHK